MITSKQNALIKEIRSLADKKFRDELNLYLIEGTKIVKEAIRASLPIKAIVGTEKALSLIDAVSIKTETVSDDVFKSISSEVTPQGVIAIVEKPNLSLSLPSGNCLLLDGVSDPANVGAIIRTAAASGYNDVYLTLECADAYSPKAVRSSMSGIFRINVYRADIEQILSVLKLPLVVADMFGESVFTKKIKQRFCLVIGNEGRGVSQKIKNSAAQTVSIPMENGVESLNAAVSAGILMYNLK